MKIGFIGVGVMGNGMVINLLKRGFQVDACARTREKAAQAEAAGAVLKDSIRECVEGADAVITISDIKTQKGGYLHDRVRSGPLRIGK